MHIHCKKCDNWWMCIFCSSLQRTTSLVTHLKAIHVYHISTSRHEINRLAIYTKLKKQEILNWSWTDLWFQFSRFTITARGKGAKFHNSASTTILKWRLGFSMATRNNWSWTASCFKFSPFHNHKIGQAARVETARDQISRFCVDNYFKMTAWLSFRGNNK